MTNAIEVRGLTELIERMRAYPRELQEGVEVTMDAAMLTLHENVPPYPPPPDTSTYDRTGTLGRTLGSSESGGKAGTPDVYEVREMGSAWEGHFGTNLEYAPYVIGDDTQAGHMGHWWTMKVVAERATDKINRMFETLAKKLASFLEGKG
jgi:hypothetical protein